MAYQDFSAKGKKSFSDAVNERPEDFVHYAFEVNPNIKDFGEFADAFREKFDTERGANAKIDEQDLINLFESNECKDKMKENVSPEEYEKLYGDGIIVERYPAKRKNEVVTITAPKVNVKPHTWKQKQIKPYIKTKNREFSGAEVTFLQVKKQKAVRTSQIIKDFNSHFSKNPRTPSSIRSKVYRV